MHTSTCQSEAYTLVEGRHAGVGLPLCGGQHNVYAPIASPVHKEHRKPTNALADAVNFVFVVWSLSLGKHMHRVSCAAPLATRAPAESGALCMQASTSQATGLLAQLGVCADQACQRRMCQRQAQGLLGCLHPCTARPVRTGKRLHCCSTEPD